MKQRLFFSVLLAIFTLSPLCFAQERLSWPAMHAFAQNWSVTCDDRPEGPELEPLILAFSKASVRTGFNKLYELNPTFANTLIERGDGIHLRLRCSDPTLVGLLRGTRNDLSAAQSVSFPWPSIPLYKYLWLGVIPYTLTPLLPQKDKLNTGEAMEHFMNTFTMKDFPDSDQLQQYLKYTFFKSAPQVPFHEFLHSVNADNLDVDTHNRVEENKNTHPFRERDIVYACTAQAFPDADIDGFILSAEGKRTPVSFNTKTACMTCALAKNYGVWNGLSDDPADWDRARQKCSDLK